ncbi:MAG: carbonic anhydrase [Actinomycetaceae bacterium]|nr:carbonic anhydrase [Actinomycetaceae bacterium]
MTAIDELLANNNEYAKSFPGEAGHIPSMKTVVVTCMDSRLNPYEILGLSNGEVHVLRNAGGVVTSDTIRTLSISQRTLGTRSIMLMQHSDCGLSKVDDAKFMQELREQTGETPSWTSEAFTDVEESVRHGMELIRQSPFVDSSDLRGFIYDVKTGALSEVL